MACAVHGWRPLIPATCSRMRSRHASETMPNSPSLFGRAAWSLLVAVRAARGADGTTGAATGAGFGGAPAGQAPWRVTDAEPDPGAVTTGGAAMEDGVPGTGWRSPARVAGSSVVA